MSSAATPDPARDPSAERNQTIRTFLLTLVLAFGFRTGVAQAYVVDGPSMEPTVFQGERLVVLRAAYGLSVPFVDDALVTWAEPSVGDVVVIESPADGVDLVKRVIGVGGDLIAVEHGVVFRNGQPLERERIGACDPARQIDPAPECIVVRESGVGARAWATSSSDPADGSSMPAVRVPPGHVFVMGDHRDRSNDSRRLGPIPSSRLRGRVLFVE